MPFLLVGLLELYLSLSPLLPPLLSHVFLWAGLSTTWVGLAYLLNLPSLLGKYHLPHLSRLLLLPFFLTAWTTAWIGVKTMKQPRVELIPGLWVGGWPLGDTPDLCRMDLTAELFVIGKSKSYTNIPMLDGVAPRPEDFARAVASARALRLSGQGVLIHCAYGHGRSVMVCLAVMVAEGHFPDWETAHAHVLTKRPLARMSRSQRAFLTQHLP